MKIRLLALGLVLFALNATAQTANRKFGITSGGAIQHYQGDLGSSFLKFNSNCFGAEVITLGYYLDKTFDINLNASIGDFGYCQPASGAAKAIALSKRCPGCKTTGMGELRSRMVAGGLSLKYKLNNGIVFSETSRIAPYFYFGAGVNYLSDRMKRKCVDVGTHFSVNTGFGIKYNFNDRFNAGYNLGISTFTRDKVYATISDSPIEAGGKKDMLMQNTLFLGMNF